MKLRSVFSLWLCTRPFVQFWVVAAGPQAQPRGHGQQHVLWNVALGRALWLLAAAFGFSMTSSFTKLHSLYVTLLLWTSVCFIAALMWKPIAFAWELCYDVIIFLKCGLVATGLEITDPTVNQIISVGLVSPYEKVGAVQGFNKSSEYLRTPAMGEPEKALCCSQSRQVTSLELTFLKSFTSTCKLQFISRIYMYLKGIIICWVGWRWFWTESKYSWVFSQGESALMPE